MGAFLSGGLTGLDNEVTELVLQYSSVMDTTAGTAREVLTVPEMAHSGLSVV